MKYFEDLPGSASKRDGTAAALVKFLQETLEGGSCFLPSLLYLFSA
jgi:hypothetical protein